MKLQRQNKTGNMAYKKDEHGKAQHRKDETTYSHLRLLKLAMELVTFSQTITLFHIQVMENTEGMSPLLYEGYSKSNNGKQCNQ